MPQAPRAGRPGRGPSHVLSGRGPAALRCHRDGRGGRLLAAASGRLRSGPHAATLQDGEVPGLGKLQAAARRAAQRRRLHDAHVHVHDPGVPLRLRVLQRVTVQRQEHAAPTCPRSHSEMTRVKQWVADELVARMGKGSMWDALKVMAKLRMGIVDGSIFAFVDDLHNSNRAYCRELWAALKPLNIKWGCQSTLSLGDDEESVKLAAD